MDSISRTLAWRLNQHLAADAATVTSARTERQDAASWNSIAWMLKAAENSGCDAEKLLSGIRGAADLTELARRVQHQQLAHLRLAGAGPSLPPWLTTHSIVPAMCADHADYLKASTELVADRLKALGEQTAATRPRWTATLGQAPDNPTFRERWQHQLAIIAAYRDQYGITDDNADAPAGPYIETGRAGHTAWWHAANAAITARHITSAPAEPAAVPTNDDAARRQLAADLYRALPEEVQAQVLRTVAIRTGAAWLKDSKALDDDALTKPAIAVHVTRAMADHGHLPAEAAKPEQRNTSSLAERRRATREAERQARRDEILARRARPGGQTVRSTEARREETRRGVQPTQPRLEQMPQRAPELIQPPRPQLDRQPDPRPRW